MTPLAADLVPLLAHGAIVALEGNLGAGKTSLARALIRNLMGDETLDVPSPTFTLLQTYESPHGTIWHFDFYRLKHPEEVYELGWEEAISSGGILILEWAEKIGPLLPSSVMHIAIAPNDSNGRDVRITA